jgi:hypothetical protein
MSRFLIVIPLFLSLWACSQKSPLSDSPVAGKFVGTEYPADTLSFPANYDGGHPTFWLGRGKDTTGLPLSNSGPYWYYLKGDSIHVEWFLSSTITWTPHYFFVKGNTLKIGNFFRPEIPDSVVLTFSRIEN